MLLTLRAMLRRVSRIDRRSIARPLSFLLLPVGFLWQLHWRGRMAAWSFLVPQTCKACPRTDASDRTESPNHLVHVTGHFSCSTVRPSEIWSRSRGGPAVTLGVSRGSQDRASGVGPEEREKLPTFHTGYEARARARAEPARRRVRGRGGSSLHS